MRLLLHLVLVYALGVWTVLSFHHASRRASSLSRGLRSLSTLSMASDSMKWKSMISSDQDLEAASREILSTLESMESIKDYNVALFYISSVYESSSFKYDILFDQLKTAVPGLKVVLGCTTGAPIGAPAPFATPIEIEARAGLSLLLGNVGDDVKVSSFQVDKQAMIEYSRSFDQSLLKDKADDGVVIMFATEMVKPQLPQFIEKIEKEEKSKILGAFASTVTSLHTPKIFIKDYTDNSESAFDKYTIGAVGVSLTGNVDLQTVVARSCLPVGPIFDVIDRQGREILTMSNPDKRNTEEYTYPLVALDEVLKNIPFDQSEALKRELLVGVVTGGSDGTDTFYGQKPLTFDPITGSITLSILPGDLSYAPNTQSEASLEKKIKFQFCIRDTVSAQEDLLMAGERVKQCLQNSLNSQSACDTEGSPLACFILGNMDRGNRMFRFQSWESIQLHTQLESLKLDQEVPIVGAFSTCAFGTVTNDAHNNPPKAYMMETDSIYGVLSKKLSTATSKGSESTEGGTSEGANRDVCTVQELSKYNDEGDTVIVTKRDPEAAAAVRVASMDYVIPEKSPQPSNVLESIVWDREQYVDRMRERFQMSKALLEATRSELKYPKRDFVSLFNKSKMNNKADISQSDGKLSAIIEFNRATLNNGKIMDNSLGDTDVSRLEAAKNQVYAFTAGINDIISNNALESANLDPDIKVAAMGCHVDFGTFKGSYEDLENIRVSSKEYRTLGNEEIPVICNDFVLYAYQLFKAKSSGADALRLYASVLPVQEINYMMKIAKKISLAIIVVVNTKAQLLEVLDKVTDLEVLNISSRNMRLWKIAPGKAESILDDADVRRRIAQKRLMGEGAEYDTVSAGQSGLIVLQEGFLGRKEVNRAKVDPLIDGVVLSEELLTKDDYNLRANVMQFLGQSKTSAQAEEDALFDPKSYGL